MIAGVGVGRGVVPDCCGRCCGARRGTTMGVGVGVGLAAARELVRRVCAPATTARKERATAADRSNSHRVLLAASGKRDTLTTPLENEEMKDEG
jgi:hypothetical protein